MTSPEALAVRATLARNEPSGLSFEDERRGWDEAMRGAPLGADVSEAAVDVGGVPALVLTPPGATTCLVHFHGGGLVAGSSVTHRVLGAALAVATGRAVILPDFRLLPEHSPADVLDDAVTVLREASHSVGPVAGVGGDSTGAALALAAVLEVPVPCLYSLSGAFDPFLRAPSIATIAPYDPLLTPAALRHWRDSLRAEGIDLAAPALNPLALDLSAAPPTLTIAGTDELWLDDSRKAHAALDDAGAETEHREYYGMWHVFPMWVELPESRSALRAVGEWIAAHEQPTRR